MHMATKYANGSVPKLSYLIIFEFGFTVSQFYLIDFLFFFLLPSVSIQLYHKVA
jgi:hypothetical protein